MLRGTTIPHSERLARKGMKLQQITPDPGTRSFTRDCPKADVRRLVAKATRATNAGLAGT
jgi:hypothetical protein